MRCLAKNCLFKVVDNNLCKRHLNRLNKFGNINITGSPSKKNSIIYNCKNKKCENLIWKKDFCEKCKRRIRLRGNENIVNPTNRKYTFNEMIFETIDDNSAWILGWIATDGYICEKRYSVKLGITDKDILEKISNLFKYIGPIKNVKIKEGINNYKRKPMYAICLNSMVLTTYLINLGIRQKKSLTIKYPKIDDKYTYSFLRGVVEGDGSIIHDKKRRRLYVYINSASLDFLKQIKDKVSMNSSIVIPNKNKKVYRLCFIGKNAVNLCEKMYENSGDYYLQRKKDKYLNYIKERSGVSCQ